MTTSTYLIPPDLPLRINAPTCAMCNKRVFEVQPLGPNGESICEDCSKLDPDATARRLREMGHG